MKPPRIDLVIDELVVRGVRADNPKALARAVERELARQFVQHGIPAAFHRNVAVDRLNAGAVTIAPNTRPAALGAQVARAVHGAFRR